MATGPDQGADVTFHTPEWHAARVQQLVGNRESFGEFEQRRKEEAKAEALVASEQEVKEQEYLRQLAADRERRLGSGGGDKKKKKKKHRDRDRERDRDRDRDEGDGGRRKHKRRHKHRRRSRSRSRSRSPVAAEGPVKLSDFFAGNNKE